MIRKTHPGAGLALFIALAAFAGPGASAADDYPNRPIRMIVGFAPGGGTDLTARPVAQKLSELLRQQVIVENRPGAAGNIATEQVARAAPDGYTILMGTIAALAINPSLYGNLKYDPEADFAPVIQVVDATNVLVLHPSVQANSVQELIALAKQKSLSAGSSGIGATGHLSIELFNLMAGSVLAGEQIGAVSMSSVSIHGHVPPNSANRLRPGKFARLAHDTQAVRVAPQAGTLRT